MGVPAESVDNAASPRTTQQWRGNALKAIVFDVDGTLYLQSPLRRAMARRLLALAARRPAHGWKTMRVLRAYRDAQERLRREPARNVGAAQLQLACTLADADRDVVAACVSRWMDEEPLDVLRQCVQPGASELLTLCRQRGLRLAALSDYPAEKKLEALGLNSFFDFVLAAQHPDIDAFKPDPKGLLVALERLEVSPAEALYVGDRADVDARAAAAAGVRSVILTPRRTVGEAGCTAVQNFAQLQRLLWP